MDGARLRQRVVQRSRSSLRELLAPECPHPGDTRGPEVPYARPPTLPSYLDGREAEMIYWRSCESSAFRAAALFLCPFSPPRHVARQRDFLTCRRTTRGLVRVRATNLYSLQVFTRWRSLKPCARPGKRSILREAPRADRAKCGVSPHLPQMIAGTGRPGPSVAPRRHGRLPGKEWAGRDLLSQ